MVQAYGVPDSRRFEMAASVLEGMSLALKKSDELGGLVYTGPNIYQEFCQHLYDQNQNEHQLKDARLVLSPIEVKEEHRYPVKPPTFKQVTKVIPPLCS